MSRVESLKPSLRRFGRLTGFLTAGDEAVLMELTTTSRSSEFCTEHNDGRSRRGNAAQRRTARHRHGGDDCPQCAPCERSRWLLP